MNLITTHKLNTRKETKRELVENWKQNKMTQNLKKLSDTFIKMTQNYPNRRNEINSTLSAGLSWELLWSSRPGVRHHVTFLLLLSLFKWSLWAYKDGGKSRY